MSSKWQNLNPYELHKTLINEYFLTSRNRALLLKRNASKDKRDIDVIRENHQFLWEDEEEEELSWEKRLAKKYYGKLFKEYCIADLSKYKDNKIGMRWRTEEEVINGKGQFSCGSKKCNDKENLKTWEVNFGYVEHGVKKNALVKLRLCPDCTFKLNYHHRKKEVKRLKHSNFNAKKRSNVVEKAIKEEQNSEETVTGIGKEKISDTSNKSEDEISNIWKNGNAEEEEKAESKTREEEFDEYLDQLFL